MQVNNVNMQLIYADMQDNYVNMQVNYGDMQLFNFDMRLFCVDMQLTYFICQHMSQELTKFTFKFSDIGPMQNPFIQTSIILSILYF